MASTITYDRTTWNHGAPPAIDADKLNNLEEGVENAVGVIASTSADTVTQAFLFMGSGS